MHENNQPNFEGALSWDSEISQESSFVVLEPGEYDFRVNKMERGTYNPSPTSKIRDVSPMAELELLVVGENGETTIKENLILHSKMEWKISEFLISIGQKQPGEPTRPNWGAIPGATGRAVIEVNKYKNKEGQDRENNRVKEFIPASPQQNNFQQQPVYQQPPQQAPVAPQPPSQQSMQQALNENQQQYQQPPQQNANPGFTWD